MKVTSNLAEVRKTVYTEGAVLVAIVDGYTEKSEFVLRVMKALEKDLRGRVLVIVCRHKALQAGDMVISLYIKGEEVMRQSMIVGDISIDRKLLKWSVNEILERYGVR